MSAKRDKLMDELAVRIVDKLTAENPGLLGQFVSKEFCGERHKAVDDRLNRIDKFLQGIGIGVIVGIIIGLFNLLLSHVGAH